MCALASFGQRIHPIGEELRNIRWITVPVGMNGVLNLFLGCYRVGWTGRIVVCHWWKTNSVQWSLTRTWWHTPSIKWCRRTAWSMYGKMDSCCRSTWARSAPSYRHLTRKHIRYRWEVLRDLPISLNSTEMKNYASLFLVRFFLEGQFRKFQENFKIV